MEDQAHETFNVDAIQPEPKLKQYIASIEDKEFTQADFSTLVAAIYSKDRFQQHFDVIGIRKLTAVNNPPI